MSSNCIFITISLLQYILRSLEFIKENVFSVFFLSFYTFK